MLGTTQFRYLVLSCIDYLQSPAVPVCVYLNNLSWIIRYSPEQLFDVVAAVDMYEDFLPWCQRSQIIRRYPDGKLDAELQIGFKLLVESYISHVELNKPNSIKVSAIIFYALLINIYLSGSHAAISCGEI